MLASLALIGLLIVGFLLLQRIGAVYDDPRTRGPSPADIARGIDGSAGPDPVGEINDARRAAAGVAVLVASMDAPLMHVEIDQLRTEVQSTLGASGREAAEIAAFGQWIASQCPVEDDGITRLCGRIVYLIGAEGGPDVVAMSHAVAEAGGPVSDGQNAAIAEIRRCFGLV